MDIYIYPETDVLINKFNIKDKKELEKKEQKHVTEAMDILKRDLIVKTKEDYYEIHKYLFGDVYDWAGEKRKVNIYKEEPKLYGASIHYADKSIIDQKLEELFSEAETKKPERMKPTVFKKHVKDLTADLWRVHPFRDGNTRTALVFADKYCEQYGYEMDIEKILDIGSDFRDALMFSNCYVDGEKANIEDQKMLDDIFNDTIHPTKEKRKEIQKNKKQLDR